MNKESEDKTILRKAIILSSILALVTVATFLVLFGQLIINGIATVPRASLFGVSVIGVLSVVTLLGTRYCRNGRINLGMGLIGAGFITLILLVPFIIRGRTTYASVLMVALVVIVVPQIFSLRIANRALALFVGAGTIAIAMDALLPTTRNVSAVPPFGLYIFAVGFLILVAYSVANFRNLQLRTRILSFLVLIPLLIVTLVGAFFIVRISSQQRAVAEESVCACAARGI